MRSKSKLTDDGLNNSFHAEKQVDSAIITGSGGGEIGELAKIHALNQNSGEITGMKSD